MAPTPNLLAPHGRQPDRVKSQAQWLALTGVPPGSAQDEQGACEEGISEGDRAAGRNHRSARSGAATRGVRVARLAGRRPGWLEEDADGGAGSFRLAAA